MDPSRKFQRSSLAYEQSCYLQNHQKQVTGKHYILQATTQQNQNLSPVSQNPQPSNQNSTQSIAKVDPLVVVEGQKQPLFSDPKLKEAHGFLPLEHNLAEAIEMQYNQVANRSCSSDADLQKRRRFLENCELLAQQFQEQSGNRYSKLSPPQLNQRSNLQFHGMRSCVSPNQNVILEAPKQNSSASFLTPQPQPAERVLMSGSQFTNSKNLSSCSLQGTQQRVMPSGVVLPNQVYEKGKLDASNLIQKIYQKAEILRIKHLPKLEELIRSLEPILFELARAGQPTELMDKVTKLMKMTESAQRVFSVPNNITLRYVRALASLDKFLEAIYASHRDILISLPQVQCPYNVQYVQQLLKSQSQSFIMQQMQGKRQVLLHRQPVETLEKAQCEMTSGNDMILTSRVCSENVEVNDQQKSKFHRQQLKFVASSSNASCQVFPSASSQISHHHSSPINKINALPRSGISFRSANLSMSPPPLTDSSPLPRDPGKLVQNAAPVNAGYLETTSPCATGSPAISPTTVLGNDMENCKNSSSMASKDSSDSEQPIQRLVRQVRSMSDKALSASVNDIKAVKSIIDRMSYSEPIAVSNSKVGQDLAATASSCPFGSRSNKRKINSLSLTTDTCDSTFQTDESRESTDTDKTELDPSNGLKRRRTEASSHTIKEEIREINQRLVDTVVDITDEDTKGTIVRCSFSILSTSPAPKSKEASALMLRLLVPKNYPDYSPILLDSTPANISENDEDLSVRVQEKLNRYLRTFCEPMSLGEIAKAWGSYAREAVHEYAAKHGGGSFTSTYGAWVNCLSSS